MTIARSASAARITGDDLQHLVALSWVLLALRPEEHILTVEIEAKDAGNLDDVVLRYGQGGRYMQVRASVDARTPLDSAYLMKAVPGGRSMLQKFFTTWRALRPSGGRVVLELVTNKSIDHRDALLRQRDHNETVALAIQAARDRETAETIAAWQEHLGCDREELIAFARVLHFKTDGAERSYRERVTQHLRSLGYRDHDETVALLLDKVREWVKDGRRVLTSDDIRTTFEGLDIRVRPPSGSLIVQAIAHVPPRDGSIVLDWVDHFDGADPSERVTLKDAIKWPDLQAELRDACAELKGAGYTLIEIRGAMRLPAWFAVGTELKDVAGVNVVSPGDPFTWSSERETDEPVSDVQAMIDQGDDLAVALAISGNPTGDVVQHLRASGISVRECVTIVPSTGPSPRAVTDPGQATGLARSVVRSLRMRLLDRRVTRIHLFMYAPNGFALMLGHLWDRLPPTQLYDFVGPGLGYAPSFLIPGRGAAREAGA